MSLLLFFATPAPIDYPKTVGGSISSSGDVLKNVNKFTTGGTSPSGLLIKAIPKTPNGSISSSGTIIKQVWKTPNGSISSSGTIIKQVAKRYVGAIVSYGTLSMSGMHVMSFVGNIVSSGVARKNANKIMFSSSSPSGALSKRVSKYYASSSSPSGTLAKILSRFLILAGQIASVGNVSKSVKKTLSGQMVGSGGILTTYLRHVEVKEIIVTVSRIISGAWSYLTDSGNVDIEPVVSMTIEIFPVNEETIELI